MDLTRDQEQAIYTHDRNLIVVAGAGSGKTRVLVERYLALLDAHPDWPLNALVAITFTRKAAQEMRDRVRQALEDRLSAAALGDQPIWAARLASMDSARIDTIHGLCTSILRANAAEVGLDPDFTVMDEVDAGILLDTVIEDELARLVEGADPALALFGEYDHTSIAAVLRTFAGVDVPNLPPDSMAFWRDTWARGAVETLNQLRATPVLRNFMEFEPPAGWPEGDRIADVWLDCQAHVESLLDPAAELPACLETLLRLDEAIKLTGGSAKKWGGQETFDQVKDYLRTVRALVQDARQSIGDPPGVLDQRAADLLPLWRRIIGRVRGAYDAAKQQEGWLNFDDLERRACDLLRGDALVRARYRQEEFRHVLVDEFQDTNAAQWEIVQALADLNQPGSLFVVGDQKQSIYAFRGADVSVFGQVRQQLTALGGPDAEIALARSFRTHQPLVEGFNAIFGRLLTRDPASPVYAYETDLGTPMDAHRQEPPAEYPTLEFSLVDTGAAEAGHRADDFRCWEAYEIALRLREMVENAVPVFDRESGVRPVRYDDMVLLFQSMSNVTLYEEVFKALGLPFVTVAGRGYYDRPEVWDLLNLLKALYNPADSLALASVLRSPLFGLSDDALLALRRVNDEAAGQRALLWDALDQPGVVPAGETDLAGFARDCLYDLAALAGRVTIAELLRESLDRTGFLATLIGLPDGARRRGNVEKLLAKAASSGRITLGAFEQYLSDLSAREVREGEALVNNTGAVTLMTIHAAKGLEFPVVGLVDTSWERGARGGEALILDPVYGLCCKVYDPEGDSLKQTYAYGRAQHLSQLRDEAERKRLLYVAATRAQDYLLVSGQIKQSSSGQWSPRGWLGWLVEALDLQSELEISGVHDVERAWGQVRLRRHEMMPSDDLLEASDGRQPSGWDRLRAGEMPLDPPVQPPLLSPVQIDPTAAARHLSVTQVADLGAQEFGDYYAQRFRRAVLQDAPGHVSPVPYPKSPQRLVGEMVHEALRWWQGGDDGRLADLLESYAWEQGIVDAEARAQAVAQAQTLLAHYRQSDLYGWLAQADRIYRELPFIYDNGQRIIHGILDVLFQRKDGTWAVVDYKTSWLAEASDSSAQRHARRFHMQVGAYAAAVREQLQLVDDAALAVYIHYVRYGLTVEITPAEWRAALDKMEPYLGRLVGT